MATVEDALVEPRWEGGIATLGALYCFRFSRQNTQGFSPPQRVQRPPRFQVARKRIIRSRFRCKEPLLHNARLPRPPIANPLRR